MELKRAVIKEELVDLTGCYKKAIILNQFIYWSQRVKDFDKFIKEENERRDKEGYELIEHNHGWIYKNSEELSSEVMLNMTCKNMRAHIKILVENGWIEERSNPLYKWDKTLQYRVNIIKIQDDLFKIGYCLEGYKIRIGCKENSNGIKRKFNEEKKKIQSGQKETAIPEITTETINKENNTSENNSDENEKPIEEEKKVFDKESAEYKMATYLYKKLQKLNPNHKKPDFQKWAKEADYLIRLDKRHDLYEIKDIIDWTFDNAFWKSKVLSISGLRKHYDTLFIQMNNDKSKNNMVVNMNDRKSNNNNDTTKEDARDNYIKENSRKFLEQYRNKASK